MVVEAGRDLHASTMALVICHDDEAPEPHEEISPKLVL